MNNVSEDINSNTQVKTRQRVTDHGEVFTSEREVNAILDLNKMYVCKTEMADKKYSISKEDQKLTKEFYKE